MHMNRKADPSLNPIELDELTSTATAWKDARQKEVAEAEEVGPKLESPRYKATVDATACYTDEGSNGRLTKADRSRLCGARRPIDEADR